MESIPENQVESKPSSLVDNMLSMEKELFDEINGIKDADEIFLRFTVSMLSDNGMYQEVDSDQYCIQSNTGRNVLSIKDVIIVQALLIVLPPHCKLPAGRKGLLTVNILSTDKNGESIHPRELSCSINQLN